MTAPRPDRRSRTLPDAVSEPAQTHDTLVLAGCMIHSRIDDTGLAWLSQMLRCVPDVGDPPAGTLQDLDMTIQVSTFDDIDTCTRIATKALGLSPIASIGIRELLVNAVEHGNLGITFEEKSELLQFGRWQEEIEQRLASAEHRQKYAEVRLKRDQTSFVIEICDQGTGFDWKGYLEKEERPSMLLHGRGMSLAMSAGFTKVEYRGTGSEVFVAGDCDQGAS